MAEFKLLNHAEPKRVILTISFQFNGVKVWKCVEAAPIMAEGMGMMDLPLDPFAAFAADSFLIFFGDGQTSKPLLF